METNFYLEAKYKVFRVKKSVLLKSAGLLIYIGLLILSVSKLSAQTSPLNFTLIPASSAEVVGPYRGAEQWNTGNVVDIPTQGTASVAQDAYYRFQWYELETGDRTYNWSVFDDQINNAIDRGQHFSFGIMPICPGCGGPQVNGSLMGYPAFLHTQMQAESAMDWVSPQSNAWIPNWNSPSYLTAVENMVADFNTHLNTTSHNGTFYKDVINYIDIRSFGAWGEWHEAYVVNNMSEHPAGTAPTTATLKRIIDAYKNGFPNFQLIVMMAAFDGYYYANTWISPEIGVYALQASNNKGLFGWRRDNWGDNADNYDPFLNTNTRGYGTLPQMKDSIMNRYKSAPIVGEPNNGADMVGAVHYGDLANQVLKYHTTSFGNGNIDFNSTTDVASSDAFRNASRLAGYRLQIEGGALSTTLTAGSPFTVTLNWRNSGITPLYEDWNVTFELRNSGGTAVWSGISTFNPHFFQPSSSVTPSTSNFTLPSTITPGTYSMYLIIRDPKGYRKPLALAINGRNTDGSYLLRSNIGVGVGNGKPTPSANAGADQTITLPTTTASLTGSGTDSGGSIASYAWSQKSGPATGTITTPATAATTITGMAQGVYVYTLTVTDNQGATATADVQITVNAVAVNQPPIAVAGADQTITLPASSVNINASGSSDPDGSISTYAWAKLSGPTQFAIGNSAAASTIVNNLTAGVYTFQLKVTDNLGAIALDTIKIIVNAAPVNQPPVANAGADITIILPTNIANLNGNASSNANGTISSFGWVQISGPSTCVITAGNTSTPTVSQLILGQYVFELTVTDNQGVISKSQVSVFVNPKPILPNQAPVANAGTNQSITLPVNNIILNGTSSFDPDGTISSFGWKQVSGPSTSVITAGNTSTPTASQLIVGQYVFELTVTDNNGAKNANQITISVNPASNNSNVPPVANAGSNDLISLPNNSYILNATKSTGSIVSYTWNQTSGPNTVNSAPLNGPMVTISDLQVGDYSFQVTVIDNAGATSTAIMKLKVVEPSLSDQLIIYPNPAHDVINEKITSPITGKVKINIYDMNGRLVLSTQVEKTGDMLIKTTAVGMLAPGMYTIQINIANRKTMAAKFIKS